MSKFKPNIYLTNMAMAYFAKATDFVAKALFPICKVDLQSSHYYKFNKGDLARDNVDTKPAFGSVQPALIGQSDETYVTENKQVIVGIDKINALNFQRTKALGVHDPRRAKVKFATEQLLIHQDRIFAESFFKSGVWGTEFTGKDTIADSSKEFLKFNDSNFKPVEFFGELSDRVLQEGRRKPNKLALGVDAYNALKNHPEIVERVKYTGSTNNPGIVNVNALAAILELDEVVVLQSTYNKAGPGEAPEMSFICDSNAALLCYATDTPNIEEPSAGYIFAWDLLGDGNTMAFQQFEGPGGSHAEFIEGLMSIDMKKTGDDLAVFLADCV